MTETTFKLRAYCMVGWDDNEEIGEIEVYTFHDLLKKVSCLMNNDRDRELYNEIKEEIEVPSGGEVFSVGEPDGIIAVMKSDDGVTVEIKLSDNSGVSSWHRVDGKKYESKYKDKMREVRKLATEIMRI